MKLERMLFYSGNVRVEFEIKLYFKQTQIKQRLYIKYLFKNRSVLLK